jgi:hypothetical protein
MVVLTGITERADPSLVAQRWVGDKPCLVTVNAGMYVTVARPDITPEWPKRQPDERYMLQMVCGEGSFPDTDSGARHSQLCPPTPEAGEWSDENSVLLANSAGYHKGDKV